MAQEVGLLSHYKTFYAWASSMQHGDIGGLISQADGIDVDVAPSMNWVKEALVTGHHAAVDVLDQLNQVAGLEFDKEIQVSKDSFEGAWKI